MSAYDEWDPAAALRAAATARTIAPYFRHGWENDVRRSLTDNAIIYGLGGEIEQSAVRDTRRQILESLESVITSSGLGTLNTNNITSITWDVRCMPDENNLYHWDPSLSGGFLSCIASVYGAYEQRSSRHPSSRHHSEAGLLAGVQLPIMTRAPVQPWSTATVRHLDSAITRDRRARRESWNRLGGSVPDITTQLRNSLLDSKDDGFDTWEERLGLILQENRMCVSAHMDATVQGRSVRVDATYSGWYWGDEGMFPLDPVNFVVACSRQRDGSWRVE